MGGEMEGVHGGKGGMGFLGKAEASWVFGVGVQGRWCLGRLRQWVGWVDGDWHWRARDCIGMNRCIILQHGGE